MWTFFLILWLLPSISVHRATVRAMQAFCSALVVVVVLVLVCFGIVHPFELQEASNIALGIFSFRSFSLAAISLMEEHSIKSVWVPKYLSW